MQMTRVSRIHTRPDLATAADVRHIYRGLLLLLALSSSITVWSQTAPDFREAHRHPPNRSTGAPLERPATNAQVCADYKFITIDADGSTNAVADGINNKSLVSGYYEDSSSIYHGFVWRDDVFTKVDHPGAAYTKLYSLNNRGVVIGLYGNSSGTTEHTVTYSAQSHEWTMLPDIAGYPYNEGYGINDDGVAVGNAFTSSGSSVAWIWDPATLSYSFFTVPGAAEYSTSPSGLNDKGQVAGYFADASGAYHGFLKEYGTYTTIDVPGAPFTFLDGLNSSGIIQGQIYDAAGAAEGFVATSGGVFTIVNYPGAANTALVGINDRGDLSGSYWETFGVNTAFIALRFDQGPFEY
jgi:hypothetical protein